MKTRSKVLLNLVTVAALCFVSSTLAEPITNIVINGGFETGDFTGWTQSGNTSRTGVSHAAKNSGDFGAFFGPVGSLGYISQNLSTTAGSIYKLDFSLNGGGVNGPSAPVDFQVFWNGSMIFETTTPPLTYTQFSFTGLVATGSTTSLQFGFRNDSGFFFLDDVKAGIIGAGIPEAFSTLWLALPILLMAGFIRLSRKPAPGWALR